ncbi:MAG TPA: hypothetical protein VHG53_06420 [Candidatus Limnocylindria bacterium]|nr:hypothetical protein [Candidatus Limnocylindria bacterium]
MAVALGIAPTVRFIASPGRSSSFAIASATQPMESVVYRETPQAALT